MSSWTQDMEVTPKPFTNSPLFIKAMAFLSILFAVVIAVVLYYSSVGKLYEGFLSENADVRRMAVDSMILKGNSAGDKMRSVAKDASADMEARRLAVYVLGEIKYAPALDDLRMLFREGEPPLRAQSAFALGRYGDRSMVPELLSAFETAPRGVQLKTVMAMGELGGKEAGRFLLQVAASNDELLGEAAKVALDKLKEKK